MQLYLHINIGCFNDLLVYLNAYTHIQEQIHILILWCVAKMAKMHGHSQQFGFMVDVHQASQLVGWYASHVWTSCENNLSESPSKTHKWKRCHFNHDNIFSNNCLSNFCFQTNLSTVYAYVTVHASTRHDLVALCDFTIPRRTNRRIFPPTWLNWN